MRRIILFTIISGFLFFGIGAVFFKCKKSISKGDIQQRLQIVCTVGMIADVVEHIAGDYIDVTSLMGPGIDPHLYKAREGDIYKLLDADLILFNGLHLEGKMDDLFRSMNKKTIAVAEVIPKNKLIETEFSGTYDPHVWHDVSLWIEVTEAIKKQIIDLDPQHSAQYAAKTKNYIKKLCELDDYIKKEVEKLTTAQRILVTAHDAFSYFGKAYKFKVIGLQGISTDAEISTKDIKNLADFIVQKKVPAIFVESSIPQRSIEAVQKAVAAQGWEVAIGPELLSDALGNYETNTNTYHSMIKHNIDGIIFALQRKIQQ